MENILHIHRINKVKAVSRRFNLIELMVVILVIAIIAAFILSSISRAREYALQTSCANNLHQISIAHQSYKAEYKYFPRPYSWLDDFSLIYPYTLSFNVFKCPGKYPKTKIEKISDLNGGTDYWVCTILEFHDLELNGPTAVDNPEDYPEYTADTTSSDSRVKFSDPKDKDLPSEDNGNQGTGNNIAAYFYDPSNPKFIRVAADKLKMPLVYDRYGPAHFKSINVGYIDDTRTGTMRDMCFIWTLDKQDTLFIDAVTPWPKL